MQEMVYCRNLAQHHAIFDQILSKFSLAFANAMFSFCFKTLQNFVIFFCKKMSDFAKNAPHASETLSLVAAKSN